MAGCRSTVDIVIGSVCKYTGFDAAKRSMKSLAKTVGGQLANLKAGFDLASAAFSKFLAAAAKGMDFERMTVQFKTLTGSMEAAKVHMRDLQDLGRTPPFSLEAFADASKQMLKMSDGVVGFKKDLETVGDLAQATGNDIGTVGRAFGLAYQVIRDGEDFGRAGQQLYSLGLMTKRQVAEFSDLSKSGEDNAVVWERLMEVLERYKGAMAETEQTTKGLIEAIGGECDVAITNLSNTISEAAKPALEGMLGWMRRINEDGSIEDWAEGAVESFSRIAEGAKACIGPLSKLLNLAWSAIKAIPEAVGQGVGNAVGTLVGGGGAGDAFAALGRGLQEGVTDAFDLDGAEAAHHEQRKARTKRLKKVREEEKRAALAEEAETRRAEDLAAAQKRRDDAERAKEYDEFVKSGSSDTFADWLKGREKAKADKAKADREGFAEYQNRNGIAPGLTADDVDELDESFRAWRANHDRMVEEERKANERTAKEKAEAEAAAAAKAREEARAKELADAREAVQRGQEAAGDAQSRAQNAQTEFERAFAMYRSDDHGAAQIAEERDYAADYRQLQKDARRSGQSWRIDELAGLMAAGDTAGQAAKLEEWRKSRRFTPEVESMVRAAAADQTRTTAEDELRKISANTDGLAQKLDELLALKG